MKVKEAKSITALLPNDVIMLLRPLQKSIKECSQLIQSSPWSFLAAPQSSSAAANSNGIYTIQSPASQVPLPMTPASAALGPAVQATVPSTPQSATYNGAYNINGNGGTYNANTIFTGNVFERADTFMAMNGMNGMNGMNSAASSRSATMTSFLSSRDGDVTPLSSVLSPMNSFTRFGGNGKVTF